MSDLSYHSLDTTKSSAKSEILYQYVSSCIKRFYILKSIHFLPLRCRAVNTSYHSCGKMVSQVKAPEQLQHPWQSGIRPHCAHRLGVYNIISRKDGVIDPNPQ